MQAAIGKDLNKAARELQAGNLVAIPTETVYGLAANGLDNEAIAKIFTAKNRPQFNPLILHVGDLGAAHALTAPWPEAAEKLARAFWPGPLTLLLPKNDRVPEAITAGSPLVAIRIPRQPLTLALLQKLTFPLAAPSANPSGYISPTEPYHVQEQLGEKVAYILDGGSTEVGIESTIIGFDQAGNPLLHRLGGLALEAIESVVGELGHAGIEHHKPATPGQLERHYAPRTLLVTGEDLPALVARNQGRAMGALVFCERVPGILPENQRVLAPSGEPEEAARNLFRMMRELDALGLDLILAELVPRQGLGPAINDRLFRASYDSRHPEH